MSKASTLAERLSARIAQITIANGYLTDIGLKVFRGKGKLDEADLPCTVLVEGEERVDDSAEIQYKARQRFTFEGHDECDPDHPNDKAHMIIADLKRALFSGDRTYGAMVRPRTGLRYAGRRIATRDDGARIIAASIDIDCEVTENLTEP